MKIDYIIENFSENNIQKFFCNKITSLSPVNEQFSLDDSYKSCGFEYLIKIAQTDKLNFNESLLIFLCKCTKQQNQRTARKVQFEIAKKVLENDYKDAAISIFYDKSNNFRISFIRKLYGQVGDKKYTSWKRYTYYVSKKQSNKTFKDRFNLSFKSLDEIQRVFAVEPLTKEFYNDIYKWFKNVKNNNKVTFPTLIQNNNIQENKENHIIRLITRILFIWFLQQKQLVSSNLFNICDLKNILKDFNPDDKENGSFYNAILQNLFFATLNKPIKERSFATLKNNRDIKTLYRYSEFFSISENQVIELFKNVPFVNGGLFECLDKKDINGNEYFYDGFSRNYTKNSKGFFKHIANIPNYLFFDEEQGLISILQRYNFTSYENSSDEIQVSIDPEIMGHVFENLLSSCSEETKETSRKKTGSFYTPKDIVDFMVSKALIQYLQNNTTLAEDDLEQFIIHNENNLKNHEIQQVLNTLEKIKILDPACGSGAFPMGCLNKIISIFELSLDKNIKDSQLYKQIYIKKLDFIKNNIYGIDIQSIAVQICKLRFFISLICDQEKNDYSENFGIESLPNLETKFISCDTLNSLNLNDNLFQDKDIPKIQEQLLQIRKQHFNAKSVSQKKELRKQDTILREKLINKFKQNPDFTPLDIEKLARWDIYDQMVSADFFDIKWMFGIDNGFDIIIGNPPYIQLQKNQGYLSKRYANKFDTLNKRGDIYVLFYEHGVKLLKENSVLSYITSNKWLRASYADTLRQYLLKNTNIDLILDLGSGVFESATVDTSICVLTKKINIDIQKKIKAYNVKSNNLYTVDNDTFVDIKASNPKSNFVIVNTMEQSIKEKIEKYGTPIQNLNLKISSGIKTGYNNAFIVDKATYLSLINKDPKGRKIIKPVLRGRDIKKYHYVFADKYLILATNKEDIVNEYPAIYKHLLQYEKQLKNRSQYKNNHIHWLELDQNNIQSYFENIKIIYSEISNDNPPFCLDKEKFYLEATTFMMFGDNLAYFNAVLNSRLLFSAFRMFYAGGA